MSDNIYRDNLKNYRVFNGKSQQEMADLLGFSHQQSYSRLENNITKKQAEQVGIKLGVDLTIDPDKKKVEDTRKVQQFLLHQLAKMYAEKNKTSIDLEYHKIMLDCSDFVSRLG